ncbi:MAG: hypothetical protein CMN41_06745 [SAR116 cluster bacterium]|nr:hypothetical protein [SAR116 cluster bacterium]HBP58046.1 hypothetical protein [Alphaproteobacteria bacterium]HCA91531.1 hypothetical protein [Alphaproteobacteria bacterium]
MPFYFNQPDLAQSTRSSFKHSTFDQTVKCLSYNNFAQILLIGNLYVKLEIIRFVYQYIHKFYLL